MTTKDLSIPSSNLQKFLELMEKLLSMGECTAKKCETCMYSSQNNGTGVNCCFVRPVFMAGRTIKTMPPGNNIQKVLQPDKHYISLEELETGFDKFCDKFSSCSNCPLNEYNFDRFTDLKKYADISCNIKYAASILCEIDPKVWCVGERR